MNAIAMISNLLIPGMGSFFIGEVGRGIRQILIWGIGFILTFFSLGFLAVIAVSLMAGAWIRGLITAFGAQPQTAP